MNTTVVGIPWYHELDYQQLRFIFPDGNILQDTYQEWLSDAKLLESRLITDGIKAIRIEIVVKEFSDWCAVNGYRLDAKARSEYAAWMASKAVNR